MKPAHSTTPISPSILCKARRITAERGYGDRLLCPTGGEVGDNEEIQVQDELDEESEQIKVAVDPGQPTKKQVEEHRTRGHVPYRSWCRWCNLGRGRSLHHRAKATPVVPIVGLDYFFLAESGIKPRAELKMTEDELSDARVQGYFLTRCPRP